MPTLTATIRRLLARWTGDVPARRRRTPRRRIGDRGERIARTWLAALGFRIVAVNVEVQVGRAPSGRAVVGEIDIVAYEGRELVFVEVKTRTREGLFATERAVDARKRRLLVRAARRYRRYAGVEGEPYRFDVVTVLLRPSASPRLHLLRRYFSDRARV